MHKYSDRKSWDTDFVNPYDDLINNLESEMRSLVQ